MPGLIEALLHPDEGVRISAAHALGRVGEHGWDAPALWRAVCEKAGLSEEAWQDHATRLFVFETVPFGTPHESD